MNLSLIITRLLLSLKKEDYETIESMKIGNEIVSKNGYDALIQGINLLRLNYFVFLT